MIKTLYGINKKISYRHIFTKDDNHRIFLKGYIDLKRGGIIARTGSKVS